MGGLTLGSSALRFSRVDVLAGLPAGVARSWTRLARADRDNLDLGVQLLELSDQAYDLYSHRTPHEQRILLDLLCSNSEMGGGQLKVELRKPLCYRRNLGEAIANETTPSGDSEGGRPIWWAILDSNQ